jgi:hypothetical protein
VSGTRAKDEVGYNSRPSRKAFPELCSYRYALLDRDSKYGEEITELLISGAIKPKRVGYRVAPIIQTIKESSESGDQVSRLASVAAK